MVLYFNDAPFHLWPCYIQCQEMEEKGWGNTKALLENFSETHNL